MISNRKIAQRASIKTIPKESLKAPTVLLHPIVLTKPQLAYSCAIKPAAPTAPVLIGTAAAWLDEEVAAVAALDAPPPTVVEAGGALE